jgi:Vacuolar protein sorting-associated protein 62
MSKRIVIITVCLGLILLESCIVGMVSAADQGLAERYAPILYFEKNEKCYPIDISYTLNNSYLYEVGNSIPISTAPTKAMLANYTTEKFYLDNQRGTVAVGDDGIENDYQSKMTALGFKVYAHVDTTSNVIQYWFYYAFNGGNLNRHEGDWEMIQVVLSGSQPTQVMYSQHYAGQTAQWSQVDKDGDHVKVYVGRGSHANYVKPYSGKIGLASDSVGDNGKILQPTDYTVEVLSTQPWLNFAGYWGWYGANASQATESAILGEAGPQGPMFRDSGSMWQPLIWASSLQSANDYMFIIEWLVYNFVLLFVIITVLSLLLLAFLVYRRHKKYGLGPRIFSLLYINGGNVKSIGNILCIVALIVAILGLLYPWYVVSANVSVPSYKEIGTFNALYIDGLNGMQIRLPDRSGPVPLGTFVMPFYLLIGISLVFVVLSTIGISHSKKLGKRYLIRGVRLFVPFILIFIVILLVASIIPQVAPVNIKSNTDVFSAMNAVSGSPLNGQYTVQITDVEGGGSVHLQWGFGIGAYLLLFSGIILVMAGVLEIAAHARFFEEKEPLPSPKKKGEQPPELTQEKRKE